MKIQTYSVLVGSRACDAQCPYCVSKMTPSQGMGKNLIEPNWRNFAVGCRFAKDNDVSTVLLTGKGEPVLFPDQITEFLKQLQSYGFSFIDLQTNGMKLLQQKEKYRSYLKHWYELGLTHVAVSIAHYENEINREIFQPRGSYIDLAELISYLHSFGLTVRLSCVMFRGGIDSVMEVEKIADFAKKHRAEQLSIRPVNKPEQGDDKKAEAWVSEHELTKEEIGVIKDFLEKRAKSLLPLMHDAVIYDLGGQNICLTNALTVNPSSEEVRQLIFFPDGRLRYDWQYPGAILL